MVTKTFWLSFCDPDKPKGEQFLGAAVVDVTDEMAAEALIDVILRFPMAMDEAEWPAAATREAHRTGCNPGGEVAITEITEAPPDILAAYPRNQLLSRAEIEALDTLTEAAQ